MICEEESVNVRGDARLDICAVCLVHLNTLHMYMSLLNHMPARTQQCEEVLFKSCSPYLCTLIPRTP